jgi:hypothetical protein
MTHAIISNVMSTVIPAQAGTQLNTNAASRLLFAHWVPACAGMTEMVYV